MLMRIGKRLRGHAHFFAAIVPLILLMTYPTVIHVFDTSRFWVPAVAWDVWFKFWDAWHFKQVLIGQSDFYHSSMNFYPEGVSLVYQSYSLPHMILMNSLQLFMPMSNAYCLTFLLIIFFCCASGYIYCNWLFKDKWLALPGAVIFGLSQQVLGSPSQPDIFFIATIPLTLYFLHRGLCEGRTKLLAAAGVMLGCTAWFSMYIFVCNFLTVGLFVLLFCRPRWKEKSFWSGLALLGILAFVFSAGRVVPLLSDPADLDRAIELGAASRKNSDLLGYALSHRHPILYRLQRAVAGVEAEPLRPGSFDHVHMEVLITYMGLSTFALIGIGLLRKSSRRQMLPWLIIAAVFMILRLGQTLKINGIHYEDILLPKYFLDQLFPAAFATFHKSSQFQIGVLLPVAVLACYGLRTLLDANSQKRRAIVALALTALIAYETYFLPYAEELDSQTVEYIDWLAAQEDQDSIRLIILPVKLDAYGIEPILMTHQALHGYPIVSGNVARLPPVASRYIDANPALAAGRKIRGISCDRLRRSEMRAALEQLHVDGFSHVVLHKWMLDTVPYLASFAAITPAYADRDTVIYELSQLRDHCDNPPPGTDSLTLHLELVFGDVMPPLDEPVLTFHPSERVNDDALRYLSWNNDFGKNLTHATVNSAGQLSLQSTNPALQSADDIAALDAFLFLRDPVDAVEDAAWDEWLAGHFQLCGRIAATEHIAVDQYLRRDMPCELVAAADKMEVVYDNGSELRNRGVEVESGDLWIALWWRLAEGPKTAYSIQVFDSAGERVRQTDHVLNRTMKSDALDVSDLPAGEYSARLIVYDFETGASQGGEVMADGTRFQRELEIARFELDG